MILLIVHVGTEDAWCPDNVVQCIQPLKKKNPQTFRSTDLCLNGFSVKSWNKQKSLVVEMQEGNWVVMNYAEHYTCFKK